MRDGRLNGGWRSAFFLFPVVYSGLVSPVFDGVEQPLE
jgi:hypothetical protein